MISKEELEQMYLNNKMSASEIAKKINVSTLTIYNWLQKYNIPTRSSSESKLTKTKNPGKEELERMYIDEQMSTYEIAEDLDVSNQIVFIWLRKYNIATRNVSDSLLIETKNPGKEELERMYIDEQMSALKIARKVGVGESTIFRWIQKYGIQTRSRPELYGELTSNWQGGISFVPYCNKFNNGFKEALRKRDNYTCQLCGTEQNGRKLSVHHIHYDKENCYPDCVALCQSCNAKVNFDRNYYESLFEDNLLLRGYLFWSPEEMKWSIL